MTFTFFVNRCEIDATCTHLWVTREKDPQCPKCGRAT